MKTPLPYLPQGRRQLEVEATNPFMAQALSKVQEMDGKGANRAACSAIVKDGKLIGIGCNSSLHRTFCPRKALGISTGQGYELCPDFCHSRNHSESAAIRDARTKGMDTTGADVYMAGHWWACEPCWSTMIEAGVRDLYVIKDADELYGEGARKGHMNAGVLKQLIPIHISGTEAQAAASALTKVGFEVVPLEKAGIVLVLPGGVSASTGLKVFDYSDALDWRLALTRLSQEM